MSWRASCWVLGHSEVESPLRLVLISLAHAANVEGEGRVQRTTLARQTGLEPEAVEKAIGLLVRKGALELWKARPSRLEYRIPIPDDYHDDLRSQKGTATRGEMGRSRADPITTSGGPTISDKSVAIPVVEVAS